jgi:phosphoribosylanthranilate isomerase
MNKIIVQIYEIQTPSEAEKLVELGVDHIGSVLLSAERWKVPLLKDTIHTIIQSNARSSLIPLFNDRDSIFRSLEYYKPNMVHFCESLRVHEDLERLMTLQANVKKRFPDIQIMRSIPITETGMKDTVSALKLARLFEPLSDFFLTDTVIAKTSGYLPEHQPVEGFIGITGETCNWDTASKLVQSSRIPVILAGGISPENVFDGIMQVRPAGVDSCTRTNALDNQGRPIRFKKDLEKVRALVETVRRAESAVAKQHV